MNRLFGKKKEVVPPPSLQDTTSCLNGRITQLDEKILGLENELRRYKEQLKTANGAAKASIQKRALDTLKRKKMYEQQRDQVSAQSFNIDQTAFAIESIRDTQTTVAAMKAAAVQLKQEHKKINLNEIDDMQDELSDMFDDMQEISDTLGRSYNTPDGIDESDLEAELAGLEDELEAEAISGTAQPSYLQPSALPSQPTGYPAIHAPADEVKSSSVPMQQSQYI